MHFNFHHFFFLWKLKKKVRIDIFQWAICKLNLNIASPEKSSTEARLLLQNKVAKMGYYAYSTYFDYGTIQLPAPNLGLKLNLFVPAETYMACLLIWVISSLFLRVFDKKHFDQPILLSLLVIKMNWTPIILPIVILFSYR